MTKGQIKRTRKYSVVEKTQIPIVSGLKSAIQRTEKILNRDASNVAPAAYKNMRCRLSYKAYDSMVFMQMRSEPQQEMNSPMMK